MAKFFSKPTKQHWIGVKRILRYLKGTSGLGLLYTRSNSEELVGFSDSDWAGDLEDRRSNSGYLFKLSGAFEEQEADISSSLNCRGSVCGSLNCRGSVCGSL